MKICFERGPKSELTVFRMFIPIHYICLAQLICTHGRKSGVLDLQHIYEGLHYCVGFRWQDRQGGRETAGVRVFEEHPEAVQG